jgi:hypothetical protein
MQQFFMTTWARFVEIMHNIPLINYGFGQNEGIWMHIIGAAILAKIFRTRFSYIATIFIILLIAVVWELFEIYIETPNMTAILSIYNTMPHYLYDTAGDIIGAVVITIIALYPSREK